MNDFAAIVITHDRLNIFKKYNANSNCTVIFQGASSFYELCKHTHEPA